MLTGSIPRGADLDGPVGRARPQLTWNPDKGAYTGPIGTASPSTLPSRQTTHHGGGAVSAPASPLRLARLGESPVFRAIEVPVGRSDDLAKALVNLLGAEWIDVTSVLLGLMRARAEQAQVPWSTIVSADSGAAQDRQGLAAFVEQALPDLFTRVERTPGGPVVLTDLATLAAYGLLGRLSRWTDLTTPPPRTILALIPRGPRPSLTVDGVALHLNSPEQSVALAEHDVRDILDAARALENGQDRATIPATRAARVTAGNRERT